MSDTDCEISAVSGTDELLLQTILRLCDRSVFKPLSYANHSTGVIQLALALLEFGYKPISPSDDLWMYLAEDHQKVGELSRFLSPVGGSFHRVTILTGVAPRIPLAWQEAAKRFELSTHLKTALEEWTTTVFNELLMPMRAKGKTPTPSDRSSTASRPKSMRKKVKIYSLLMIVGEVLDINAPSDIAELPPGTELLEVAHILPFSARQNNRLREMLSMFADEDINELLTGPIHKAFDSFRFGLECQDEQYVIRKFSTVRMPQQLKPYADGTTVTFGQNSRDGAVPSPLLCNLHVAIGRVLHAKELKDGDVEGDYWLGVGASYIQRQLKNLLWSDELATDRLDDEKSNGDEAISLTRSRTICT
ncbi:hypothetical protein V1525DRAFT_426522 [Lipomyces kononenkoae]|uniref:Uncharacterized protein n=1 Tax=Lipomyces kononenkoae TaxID=34357 RepID=A0ACC3SZS0_LIPKO